MRILTSIMRVPRSIFGISNEAMNEALRPLHPNELKQMGIDRFQLRAVRDDIPVEDLNRMEAEGHAIKERWKAHWAAREAQALAVQASQVPSQPEQH